MRDPTGNVADEIGTEEQAGIIYIKEEPEEE